MEIGANWAFLLTEKMPKIGKNVEIPWRWKIGKHREKEKRDKVEWQKSRSSFNFVPPDRNGR